MRFFSYPIYCLHNDARAKRIQKNPSSIYDRMAYRMLSIIVMINIIITSVAIKCSDKNCCHARVTIVCCEGYVLQVQNQTTASCVKYLAPGKSCYQTNQPCCSGYRCGSGPLSYPEPQPTDKCISELIVGCMSIYIHHKNN